MNNNFCRDEVKNLNDLYKNEDFTKLYINSFTLSEKFSEIINNNKLEKKSYFTQIFSSLDEYEEKTKKNYDNLNELGNFNINNLNLEDNEKLNIITNLLNSIQTREDIDYIFINKGFEINFNKESYSDTFYSSLNFINSILNNNILTKEHIDKFNKILELPKVMNWGSDNNIKLNNFLDYLKFFNSHIIKLSLNKDNNKYDNNITEGPNPIIQSYNKYDNNITEGPNPIIQSYNFEKIENDKIKEVLNNIENYEYNKLFLNNINIKIKIDDPYINKENEIKFIGKNSFKEYIESNKENNNNNLDILKNKLENFLFNANDKTLYNIFENTCEIIDAGKYPYEINYKFKNDDLILFILKNINLNNNDLYNKLNKTLSLPLEVEIKDRKNNDIFDLEIKDIFDFISFHNNSICHKDFIDSEEQEYRCLSINDKNKQYEYYNNNTHEFYSPYINLEKINKELKKLKEKNNNLSSILDETDKKINNNNNDKKYKNII